MSGLHRTITKAPDDQEDFEDEHWRLAAMPAAAHQHLRRLHVLGDRRFTEGTETFADTTIHIIMQEENTALTNIGRLLEHAAAVERLERRSRRRKTTRKTSGG